MINNVMVQNLVDTTQELIDESIKVYETHPDKDELIHFRNLIENCLHNSLIVTKELDEAD
jgi:hypothetical protein